MRSSATAERVAPRLGLVVSVLLHAALVAAMFVTFTRRIDLGENALPVVPVDLVTVADQTNIAPVAAPEPPKPSEPQMMEPVPQELQAPQFDIAPEKAKPAPKPQDANAEKLQNLIANLAQHPPANARTGPRAVEGVGAETAMAADLSSVLFSEIRPCWNPPLTSPHPETLVVVYQISLRRDGTVANLQLVSPPYVNRDNPTPLSAAVEAAERAVNTCQPYRLPQDRYGEWRRFNFKFDPRDYTAQ